ncbi:MAG: type III secretion system export apparatus subunit SctS [Burkholderiales bacterium]|jgi:type III secretion protein S|nr:type III secretion system export apparatus subunit SctS [Burkholderiales bacterium]
MPYDAVLQLASEALTLCLLLSLPAVLTSSIVGLLVAFISAITSLQDSSIAQGLKLVCVTVVVLFTAPWAGTTLMRFAEKLMGVMFK